MDCMNWEVTNLAVGGFRVAGVHAEVPSHRKALVDVLGNVFQSFSVLGRELICETDVQLFFVGLNSHSNYKRNGQHNLVIFNGKVCKGQDRRVTFPEVMQKFVGGI